MSRFSSVKSAKSVARDLDAEIRLFQDQSCEECQECGAFDRELNDGFCFDCVIARNNRDFYRKYSTATIGGVPMTIERITR